MRTGQGKINENPRSLGQEVAVEVHNSLGKVCSAPTIHCVLHVYDFQVPLKKPFIDV